MCTFWTLCSHVCEPNLSWKVLENEFCESWKTLEFGLFKSWKVLENSFLLSVRTLFKDRSMPWILEMQWICVGMWGNGEVSYIIISIVDGRETGRQ